MSDRFSRLISLIGEDSFFLLREKTVLVLGCGGVGGYVVEALARSGIGSLILVDFDVIEKTNINRQIIALDSTVGKKKVDVLEQRIHDINPACRVIKVDQFIDAINISSLFDFSIDYFVDACDTMSTKKSVISCCIQRNIPFISCMGTAKRVDPSQLEIVDLRKTFNDPMARILRKYIKDQNITKKVTVLFSREVAKKTETLGSTSFVPSSAGLLIASHVVRKFIADIKNDS